MIGGQPPKRSAQLAVVAGSRLTDLPHWETEMRFRLTEWFVNR
jgi:hypothetical protein